MPQTPVLRGDHHSGPGVQRPAANGGVDEYVAALGQQLRLAASVGQVEPDGLEFGATLIRCDGARSAEESEAESVHPGRHPEP